MNRESQQYHVYECKRLQKIIKNIEKRQEKYKEKNTKQDQIRIEQLEHFKQSAKEIKQITQLGIRTG